MTETFDGGSEPFRGLASARERFFGFGRRRREQNFAKDLQLVGKQLGNSQRFIDENIRTIRAMVKGNKELTDALKGASDSKVQDVIQSILEGRDVTRKQTQEMVATMKNVSGFLEQIKNLDLDQLNLSRKNLQRSQEIVSTLRDETDETKTEAALRNLEDSTEQQNLTNKRLQDFLSKATGKGKQTLGDLLSSGDVQGFRSRGRTLRQGLFGAILGATGLGGLDDIFNLSGAASNLVGRGLGAAGAGARVLGRGGAGLARGALGVGTGALGLGARGLGAGASFGLKGLAGLAGKFAGFAKFAGPLGLAIAAGKGIFDFGEGFVNAAEIAGLGEGEEASLTQKIQAGISNALSGLTFGLIDTEQIYKGIDIAKEFLVERLKGLKDAFLNLDFFGFVKEWMSLITGGLSDRVISLVQGFLENNPIAQAAMEKLDEITEYLSGLPDTFLEPIRNVFGDITKIVGEAFNSFVGSVKEKVLGFKQGVFKFFGFGGEEPTTAATPESGVSEVSTAAPISTVAREAVKEPGLAGEDQRTFMEGMLKSLSEVVATIPKGQVNIQTEDPERNRPRLQRQPAIGDPMLAITGTILGS